MHLSAHHWMRAEPLEVSFSRFQRFGYESVEIVGEPDKYQVDDTKALLQKYGLRCWGTATLMFGDRDLISNDAAQRRRTINYCKRVVQMSYDLGGQICTVVASPVGKTQPTSSAENEWTWAIEGLREVAAFAHERNIRIALEPQHRFLTYFLNRVDQTLTLAKEVGYRCGIAYDTFHACIEEKDMYQALEDCGDYLVDFHVSENNRLAPGDGSLDWPRLLGILRTIGYDGGLTL